MKNTKIIIILVLIEAFSLWFFFWFFLYLPIEKEHQAIEDKKLKELEALLAKISTSEKKEEIFHAKYSIIFEEDISNPYFSRFAQYIYVPLNLSKEELKQNILHAAKNLKNKKNADKVIIFAYRQDDKLHQVYTAGRCFYTSALDFTFDIAEVYYKTKKTYPATTEAIINRNNVILYSQKHLKPEDEITRLKAGTEIMIIERYRSFNMNDFIDIYKVLVWPHKNEKKQYLGWIVDDNVIEVIRR